MSEDLKDKTIAELTEIYNKHASKPVKKFRSKADALKKTRAAMKKAGGSDGGGKGRKSQVFGTEPDKEIEPPREGSKRDQLLKLLRGNGAKIETIEKQFGWTRANAMEALRNLVNLHGYGLDQNENGTITVKE